MNPVVSFLLGLVVPLLAWLRDRKKLRSEIQSLKESAAQASAETQMRIVESRRRFEEALAELNEVLANKLIPTMRELNGQATGEDVAALSMYRSEACALLFTHAVGRLRDWAEIGAGAKKGDDRELEHHLQSVCSEIDLFPKHLEVLNHEDFLELGLPRALLSRETLAEFAKLRRFFEDPQVASRFQAELSRVLASLN